jgi:hypothetical protein
MSAENPLLRWTPDVNAGNLVTWAIVIFGLVASYVNTQRDIESLTEAKVEIKSRITQMEIENRLRDNQFAELRGDIRVIRQILENGGRVVK